jgi:hypothetical protein
MYLGHLLTLNDDAAVSLVPGTGSAPNAFFINVIASFLLVPRNLGLSTLVGMLLELSKAAM